MLILCPTRELAVQVSEEVHKLAWFKKGVRALPIYGGQSYERQFAGLKAAPQVIIGTPGRLMDHLERGTLRLDGIQMAILDEADEMLNMGFRDDIEFLLGKTPAAETDRALLRDVAAGDRGAHPTPHPLAPLDSDRGQGPYGPHGGAGVL